MFDLIVSAVWLRAITPNYPINKGHKTKRQKVITDSRVKHALGVVGAELQMEKPGKLPIYDPISAALLPFQWNRLKQWKAI